MNVLGAQVANLLSGRNQIFGRNVSLANLLRPYPQFGAVTASAPTGDSNSIKLQKSQRSVDRFFHTAAGFNLNNVVQRDSRGWAVAVGLVGD